MTFDNETLLARYNKRAAEAGGSRAQPRLKKARTSSNPARGNPTSPGTNVPSPLQKNKEPRSASRPTKASGSRDHRSDVHREGSPPSGEVAVPISARTVSPRPASGSTPSSGVPPFPSPAKSCPPSSPKVRPPRSSDANPPSSSNANPPSSSNANPPSSEEIIIGSGGDRYDPEWSLTYTDSALEDSRVAREIVRGASLPVDRALLKVGAFREFVDQTYCSAVRHLHEVDMMAEAISSMWAKAQASDKESQALRKDLGEAQVTLNKAEEKAKEAESELGRMDERVREAEEKANKAESELERTGERIREMESEYALCQSALRTSEAHVADLSTELKSRRHESDLLKLKLKQAEEREKKAEERVKTAVENFRQSTEYQDELAEEAVDGLIRGFEDFREQAARLCPKIDFRRLRPRLGSADDEDSTWLEELENNLEVIPPTLPEVVCEATSEIVAEAAAPEVVAEAAAPEVVAEAAAPEVVAEAAPTSSIANIGNRD